MFTKTTIRRFAVLGMLLIFTFNIIPKRFLHEMFADHAELCANSKLSQPSSVAKLGYQCDCDNLLLGASFLKADLQIVVIPTSQPFVAIATPIEQIHSNTLFSFGLRGPPSIG